MQPAVLWRALTLIGAAGKPSSRPAAGREAARSVASLADGDAQALFGFVRRLGLSDEQADDAVQEVFARLLGEQHRGINIANPRAWAYRSIYRLAMDEHRLRTRIRAMVGALGHRAPQGNGDLADRVAVWAEVDRLPLRQRQVIYLRYRADLDYAEIGQVLGITASAARSHATQAMTTLRARLTTDAGEPSDGR
jgi:RNA polymerase sigma factor (sigma-70 family)